MERADTIAGLMERGAEADVAIGAPGRAAADLRRLEEPGPAAPSRALNGLGIGRGDRVALVLPNGPEMATAFLGVACGATTAPLNPAYQARGVRVLSLGPEGPGARHPARAGEPGPSRRRAREASPSSSWCPTPRGPAGVLHAPARAAAAGHTGAARASPEPEDVALVLHTSGTTSRPKLVPLTHANLTASAGHIGRTLAARARGSSASTSCRCSTSTGSIAAVLSSLAAGGCGGLHPGLQRAQVLLAGSRRFGPTWYTAVPTMHQAILGRAEPQRGRAPGAGRLRFIRSSSASLPPQVMEALEQTLRRAGDRELRHDGGRAPDGLEPAAAAAAARRARWASPRGRRSPSWTRTGSLLPPGARGRGRHPRPQRHGRLREQPGGQRQGLHPRLVPHRRPGHARRGRLSAAHRPAQGDHQPGRREDLARCEVDDGADGSPGGAAGGDLRHAPRRSWARRSPPPWCCARARASDERELREFAAARLADFKVPRKIVFLDGDPQGADRQAAAHRARRATGTHGMRIAIFGAGAIGGFLGVKLLQAGRGRHLHRARAAPGGDAHPRRHADERRRDDHRAASLHG